MVETASKEMTRRVGIVTLPGNFNYGNRLQLYATQRAFSGFGCSTSELVLIDNGSAVRVIKDIVKRIIGWKGRPGPEDVMTPERREAFKRFSANIVTEIVPRIDQGLSERFDLFSVGSDQVWNPNYISNKDDWFFLKFANPSRRMALAASVGIDYLDDSQAERLRHGVEGFSSISVRERRGAELIKKCSGRYAEVLCDPTLTLSSDEWCSVADHRLTPESSYVLAYLLGEPNAEASEILEEVTEHGRIDVVPLSDRQKECEPDAGPAEFISLVEHAEHVVTDSFHAAVFSCIFQRPLTIVRRLGGASMFSRMEQLTQMLGIENKIAGVRGFDLRNASDYTGVPEAIEFERKKFMSYLQGCLKER